MAVLYDHAIASFDTEIQPTGAVKWSGFPPIPHPEMKKHHHELHLIINGPAGSDISNCLKTIVVGPLLGPLIAAYIASSAGIKAAEDALTIPLQTCLGQAFAVSIQDEESWITWNI